MPSLANDTTELTAVQHQFASYPYPKQVRVYARCLAKEKYELLNHLKKVKPQDSKFKVDVDRYINRYYV